jgi:predicted ArsR family transcriptional regulator
VFSQAFCVLDWPPMGHDTDLERRISGIAALDHPIRRDLYRLLAARHDWTTRDRAAEALGVPRSVAAFHLDKLVEAGVVEVRYERITGRTGPGAGRPSKLYRRSQVEVTASVPDRHYDLAGSLLATAITEADRTGEPVGECLDAVARGAGRAAGAIAADDPGAPTGPDGGADALLEVIARHGYEPRVGEPGEIALANCPFHRLAQEHRTLVCGMNLDFLAGLLEGLGADDVHARLAPEPGYCCVRISAPPGSDGLPD